MICPHCQKQIENTVTVLNANTGYQPAWQGAYIPDIAAGWANAYPIPAQQCTFHLNNLACAAAAPYVSTFIKL